MKYFQGLPYCSCAIPAQMFKCTPRRGFTWPAMKLVEIKSNLLLQTMDLLAFAQLYKTVTLLISSDTSHDCSNYFGGISTQVQCLHVRDGGQLC